MGIGTEGENVSSRTNGPIYWNNTLISGMDRGAGDIAARPIASSKRLRRGSCKLGFSAFPRTI
jgi:hypothetical protein